MSSITKAASTTGLFISRRKKTANLSVYSSPLIVSVSLLLFISRNVFVLSLSLLCEINFCGAEKNREQGRLQFPINRFVHHAEKELEQESNKYREAQTDLKSFYSPEPKAEWTEHSKMFRSAKRRSPWRWDHLASASLPTNTTAELNFILIITKGKIYLTHKSIWPPTQITWRH